MTNGCLIGILSRIHQKVVITIIRRRKKYLKKTETWHFHFRPLNAEGLYNDWKRPSYPKESYPLEGLFWIKKNNEIYLTALKAWKVNLEKAENWSEKWEWLKIMVYWLCMVHVWVVSFIFNVTWPNTVMERSIQVQNWPLELFNGI